MLVIINLYSPQIINLTIYIYMRAVNNNCFFNFISITLSHLKTIILFLKFLIGFVNQWFANSYDLEFQSEYILFNFIFSNHIFKCLSDTMRLYNIYNIFNYIGTLKKDIQQIIKNII